MLRDNVIASYAAGEIAIPLSLRTHQVRGRLKLPGGRPKHEVASRPVVKGKVATAGRPTALSNSLQAGFSKRLAGFNYSRA
jgi:hypothetical protein